MNALDNIFWNAFSGDQARFATGTTEALRYAPGISPILAFRTPQDPNFDGIDLFIEQGEELYTSGWDGPVPEGWELTTDSHMTLMKHKGLPVEPVPSQDILGLQPEHAAAALELALLTKPGPFGIRTPELGDYFGIFDEGRLIAMAGERSQSGQYREISGICTHPDYTGRGYATRLTKHLIALQLSRGQTSFLHVKSDNQIARKMYEKLGFEEHITVPMRVIRRALPQ